MLLIKIFLPWVLTISVFCYLLFFFIFLNKFRNEQTHYWEKIGSPVISDPNGQIIIFKTFIFSRNIPCEVYNIYKKQFLFLRFLFFLTALSFIFLWSLIALGIY